VAEPFTDRHGNEVLAELFAPGLASLVFLGVLGVLGVFGGEVFSH